MTLKICYSIAIIASILMSTPVRANAKCRAHIMNSSDVSTLLVSSVQLANGAVSSRVSVAFTNDVAWATNWNADNGASIEMYLDGKLVERFTAMDHSKEGTFTFLVYGLKRGVHLLATELTVNGALLQYDSSCVFVK